MKKCYKCNKQKPLNEFPKSKPHKDGIRNECKKCYTAYMIAYYQSNPEKKAAKNKMNSLRVPNWKRHGISEEKYLELLEMTNGKCHACRENKATQIDHDHSCCDKSFSCGKCIRGVLCHNCNTAIGLMRDSKIIALRIADYLY